MGRDKARLPIPGTAHTLLQSTVGRLAEVCGQVVVADRGRGADGFAVVADGPGRGPAAGLLGAAARFPESDLLVLACDLPAVPTSLLRWLCQQPGDLVVPARQRGLEPLSALYRPLALSVLETRVNAGNLALYGLAAEPGLTVRRVEEHELQQFGAPAHMFRNLNRPSDLEEWAESSAASQ